MDDYACTLNVLFLQSVKIISAHLSSDLQSLVLLLEGASVAGDRTDAYLMSVSVVLVAMFIDMTL